MKLIAHRGNIFGPNPIEENNPDYINTALIHGFDVEVDVWAQWQPNNMYAPLQWFLGHDGPQYSVSLAFLENPRIWCHAKNYLAMIHLNEQDRVHYFWHQSDMLALTSKGYLWTCDVTCPSNNTVLMATTHTTPDPTEWGGLCSDWVGEL